MKKLAIGAAILLGILVVFRSLTTQENEQKEAPVSIENKSGTMDQPSNPKNAPAAVETPLDGVSANETSESDPDLSNRIKLIESLLPSIDQVRTDTQDALHGAPPGLIEVGGALGELEEYLERSPGQIKAASRFYAECAENRKTLPAARALCLHSLKKHPNEWAPGIKERISRLDAPILDLESQI